MSIVDEYSRFPDVHPNIVLKTELLRRGLVISRPARTECTRRDDILWRSFRMLSFDADAPALYEDKIPTTFHLADGCPVQIRTNNNSPYVLDYVDGAFFVSENGDAVAKGIYFDPKPKWYDMALEDGTPLQMVVQGRFGEFMYTCINRYCEFWHKRPKGLQCRFCNINAAGRFGRGGAEDFVADLDPELLARAIEVAYHVDARYRLALVVTGGTILGKYRGQSELEFYCTRLNAIREALQAWMPSACQIDAQTDEGWTALRATGVSSVQPNIEVWGKDLFAWICPGKSANPGYDEWIKRTIRAVDFWGRGMVNPGFLIGVEMAKPFGFSDVRSAVKSTVSGWDLLMGHGVLPRYNQWYIEWGSSFAGQEPPRLEFFIEVQKAYAELRQKHNFDPPFPAAHSRTSYPVGCLHDFEYYHGTGPLSRKSQEEMLARGTRHDVRAGGDSGHTMKGAQAGNRWVIERNATGERPAGHSGEWAQLDEETRNSWGRQMTVLNRSARKGKTNSHAAADTRVPLAPEPEKWGADV